MRMTAAVAIAWEVYWVPRPGTRHHRRDLAAAGERPIDHGGHQLGTHVVLHGLAQHPPRLFIADRAQKHIAFPQLR